MNIWALLFSVFVLAGGWFIKKLLDNKNGKSNKLLVMLNVVKKYFYRNSKLKELNLRAKNGDPEAQFILGNMYYFAREVNEDYNEAAKWYLKAAEQGHAEAQLNIGFMYEKGKGLPQNYSESFKWYTKAAEQGLAAAQFNIGFMYYVGKGTARNYPKALKWLRKAAMQEYGQAQKLLQELGEGF